MNQTIDQEIEEYWNQILQIRNQANMVILKNQARDLAYFWKIYNDAEEAQKEIYEGKQ